MLLAFYVAFVAFICDSLCFVLPAREMFARDHDERNVLSYFLAPCTVVLRLNKDTLKYTIHTIVTNGEVKAKELRDMNINSPF